VLQLFIWRDHPVVFDSELRKPRFFLLSFLVFTLAYAGLVAWTFSRPEQAVSASGIASGLNLLLLVLLAVLRIAGSAEEFTRAGLSGGRLVQWLGWGAGLAIFYALATLLNRLFNLGEAVALPALLQTLAVPGEVSPAAFLTLVFAQSVIAGPLLGLVLAFGEEYGWRGFLQSELFRMGRIPGVLVLGLVWGAWHYPVVWMGHSYPDQPVLGSLMMTIFTVFFGIVLSYAVLKTGSIWLAAFLHAVNNQALSFFSAFIYQPRNALWSFSAGFLLLFLAVPAVVLIFRDPVWKPTALAKGSEPLIQATLHDSDIGGNNGR
jgi:membrane protease YdiL (CAAX protease family)